MDNYWRKYLLVLRATGLLPALLQPIRSSVCFFLLR